MKARISDANHTQITWSSRLHSCLVMLIVPTLVALTLATLRPHARIRSLSMHNADHATITSDGQSIALPAGALKSVLIDRTDMTGYDQVDVRSTTTLNLIRSIPTVLTRSITLHPDGQRLAVVGLDGIIRLYRLADGRALHAFDGYVDYNRRASFSPDGQLLAADDGGGVVQIWRVSDGKLLHTIPTQGRVKSVVFSPDGQRLAAYAGIGNVVLWQISDGRELRRFQEDNINIIRFSPNGSLLAIGTSYAGPGPLHGEVHVWDLTRNAMQPRWTLYHPDFVDSIDFDASGHYLAAGGAFATLGSGLFGDGDFWPVRKVIIWRVRDGQQMQTIRTPHKEITTLAFSADGTTLFSTGRDRNFAGNLGIWRVLPRSRWWDWLIPGSFIAALVGQLLWRRRRRR